MLRSDAVVSLDGLWLRSVGPVDSVKWSSRWGAGPCGPDVASCTLAVDRALDSTWLRPRSTFDVYGDDGVKRFGGRLLEIGRGYPREIVGRGVSRQAVDFDAVDATGEPTTNPQVAVTQAIARGLPWTNATAFPNASLGTDATPTVKRLDQMLNDYAITAGRRWGTDDSGAAFWSADPTTPTWFLDARDLDIGVADDGLFTRVRARYVSAVTGTTPTGWATAVADDAPGQALYGVIEYPMDLTGLGLLTSATALAYAQQQLALLTVPQWLSRVAATRDVLLDGNGEAAHLQSVRAGQMLRLFNVPNNLGGLRNELNLNVILGEVEWSTDEPDVVTLAPVNLAVRNLVDALTAAAREREQITDAGAA